MEGIGVTFGRESCDTDIFEHPLDDINLTRICIIRLDTVRTEASDEPLGDDDIEARGEDIVRYSHIHKALDRLSGTLGMEGREDEMARHSGLHRDRRRLEISDFTDHDDIWVLTEEGLQSGRVGIVFLLFDLTLDDTREFILDRIFESYDLTFWSIEGREHRVEGRRLTTSRWTCHDDGSIFFLHTLLDLALRGPHESEIFDLRDRLRRVEYSADSIFPISDGKG